MTQQSQQAATVSGMWHASWTVENMDRTLAFYVGLLGLQIVHT